METPNFILGNIRAYYILFWDRKRVLTQDQKEIQAFNDNLWVDPELEKFLQFMEKYFRKLIFKRRLLWSILHPIQAYRILRKLPYFLFDLSYNPHTDYHGLGQ